MSWGDYDWEAGNENTTDASVLLPWCLGGGERSRSLLRTLLFSKCTHFTIFDIEIELIDEQSHEF